MCRVALQTPCLNVVNYKIFFAGEKQVCNNCEWTVVRKLFHLSNGDFFSQYAYCIYKVRVHNPQFILCIAIKKRYLFVSCRLRFGEEGRTAAVELLLQELHRLPTGCHSVGEEYQGEGNIIAVGKNVTWEKETREAILSFLYKFQIFGR